MSLRSHIVVVVTSALCLAPALALGAPGEGAREARVDRGVAQIARLRGEAMELLEAFIAETPRDAREMPEALVRLGELRWEHERERAAARFKAWEATPVDRRGPAPTPNYQPARDLFARVLAEHPSFDRYDLALYVDGSLALEQGRQDEALARFDRLLARSPRSRFVPDAHMARAEARFGDGDYAAALAEYEEVLVFKGSELYGLAMFKSAWCLWRLGRAGEAAARFVAVFEITDAKGKEARGGRRQQLDELQGEALKDLASVFTEDEKTTARDAYAFLTKMGGGRFAGKVLRALAVKLYDQAHYDRGVAAYELLLELEPTSSDAGRWALAIAQGYEAVEDWPKLAASYERAIDGYTGASAWAKAQRDPKVVAATSSAIAAQLREHALRLHAKAQRDRTSRAEFEGAAALYSVYLIKLGGETGVAAAREDHQLHYYLAEVYLHHLDAPVAAATHYLAAARVVPRGAVATAPSRKLHHDAIDNAMTARARVRAARPPRGSEALPEAQADEELAEALAEALDQYAKLYPNDASLPELFFRQGRLYADDGVHDAAVKVWGALLEKYPKSPYALSAGELILDSFGRAKDYEGIEAWARRLKMTDAFAGADKQKKLDALVVQAVFKQGEQLARAGDPKAAAKAYLRAAKEFPKDQRAAQACVNAELAAQEAGDLETLLEAARLVTGEGYRDRPESPRGAWIAATALQSMGLFSESAELHETIVALTSKEHPHYQRFERSRDAAFNAVVLRAATGEHDKVITNGARFVRLRGSSDDADEVVFLMGKAHQQRGRSAEAVDLYRRFVARSKSVDHRVQGYVLLALALREVGDDKASGAALEAAVTLGERRRRALGPEGRYAAARARYMRGERALARFRAIQIAGDGKQLAQRLRQKAERLKQASNAFVDVVSLGVAEWTTAALYQIGRAYEDFAKALRDSPAPSGLAAADKERYEAQIDAFVVPIEERALDAYESGWKKAIELGIYNPWTARMREALGRLNAELYPPFKEIGFEVRARGPAALPALIEAPRRAPATGAR